VFKSTNGGGSWKPGRHGPDRSDVLSLAIDPAAPQTVYAGTAEGGVFKSTDGGGSWSPANSGLSGERVDDPGD